MNKVDSGLVCVEFSSIALGYRALARLTLNKEIRVLEASPLGHGFFILVSGPDPALDQSLQATRTSFEGADAQHWLDREHLKSVDLGIMDALFALASVPLEESLVVLECATVSGLLSSAQTLVQGHGLRAIEIRIQRLSSGGAYGFFTGPAAICSAAAEDVRAKLRASMREGRAEVIDSPPPSFRSHFNLSGE